MIKALTGGDSIAARFLRAEFFEFTPSFKLWLAANHKLTIRSTGHAMWRRIRLIPFDVTIPAGERDLHLVDKLRTELPGILAWAVRGCLEWQRDGLKEPATVTDATDEYREQMDVLGAFITECCIEGPDFKVSVKEFRRAYEEWCNANGERPFSQKVLAPRLEERGFESERKSNGVWWSGLMVRVDGPG